MDISNFSKTNGLSGNQALNKNSSNYKKQKTTSIQFRTEKDEFFRDVSSKSDIKCRKYFSTKLSRFFKIPSSFSGRLLFFNFRQGKFLYICLVYFYFLFRKYLFDFLYFYTSSKKKSKNEKIV